MIPRESREALENQILSEYATLSVNTRGREREIEPCDIRTCFQRDRDRIIHSKSFRRLKHKTQVFLSPQGDHYRTRLTHTLEVSQISRTIASALRLNEDLTEAIALGHDLGHTPFGHAGERTLNSKYSFKHNEQSLRVVEYLENDGAGLNLTWEVRDGILNHGTSDCPATMEGKVVRISDKIAYTNHDMDDAIRAGILKEEDIPGEIAAVLGRTHAERLDNLIRNVIVSSAGRDDIVMEDEAFEALMGLRKFLNDNLYFNPICKSEEVKAQAMLSELYDYYLGHLDELPEENLKVMRERGEEPERAVCDYISGMTDIYSVKLYEELFVPRFWEK